MKKYLQSREYNAEKKELSVQNNCKRRDQYLTAKLTSKNNHFTARNFKCPFALCNVQTDLKSKLDQHLLPVIDHAEFHAGKRKRKFEEFDERLHKYYKRSHINSFLSIVARKMVYFCEFENRVHKTKSMYEPVAKRHHEVSGSLALLL